MKRLLAVSAIVLALAGCGGQASSPSPRAPSEDPGAAMTRLINHEFAGELDASYRMLVREQREAVDHDLYVGCPPGPPIRNAKVEIVEVSDGQFSVPALGNTTVKAVRYRLSVPGADGTPLVITDTGHLVAQDGEWHWTLSRKSFVALLAGACP